MNVVEMAYNGPQSYHIQLSHSRSATILPSDAQAEPNIPAGIPTSIPTGSPVADKCSGGRVASDGHAIVVDAGAADVMAADTTVAAGKAARCFEPVPVRAPRVRSTPIPTPEVRWGGWTEGGLSGSGLPHGSTPLLGRSGSGDGESGGGGSVVRWPRGAPMPAEQLMKEPPCTSVCCEYNGGGRVLGDVVSTEDAEG